MKNWKTNSCGCQTILRNGIFEQCIATRVWTSLHWLNLDIIGEITTLLLFRKCVRIGRSISSCISKESFALANMQRF